jgi:hypothetical protein
MLKLMQLKAMSMPEKYPQNPNEDPNLPNTQELLDVYEVLNIVHTLHREATERDKKDIVAGVDAGESGALMERTFFVLENNDGDESLPCGYDQIVMKPQEFPLSEVKVPAVPLAAPVTGLTLKIPRLSHEFQFILPLPEGNEYWNDFVAEIEYGEDIQRGRYLVNSKGVVPFPSSDALDDAELHEGGPADLFSVPEDLEGVYDWTVPDLMASQLRYLIETSQMERQTQPS